MTSSTQPADPGKPKAMRPQDAATLIIIDRIAGAPHVLMGRRRLEQVFMPGKYVFPGGRVDTTDRSMDSADELRPTELAKLLLDMKGNQSAARARHCAGGDTGNLRGSRSADRVALGAACLCFCRCAELE